MGVIMSLIANAISSATGYTKLDFFKKRKIKNRVEDATAEVVEPLLHFLSIEGIAEAQQHILMQTCIEELRIYADDPKLLLGGSLDGQKIFDAKYAGVALPQAIVDEGLIYVYELLFSRIATLLCRIPAAVKDWENQAWTENFKRLDEIAAELRLLFQRLDSTEAKVSDSRDATLHLARKSLAQRVGMKLDLTGLRADAPLAGKLRDFFVHPQITAKINDKVLSVESPSQSITQFLTKSECAVIFGAPGAGKSTWTRWLQQEALTDQWDGLIIRCELRSLDAQSLPSKQELVLNDISSHVSEEISSTLIREWIDKKSIVVLLDGFDEVQSGDRDTLLEWLKDLRLGTCSLISHITISYHRPF